MEHGHGALALHHYETVSGPWGNVTPPAKHNPNNFCYLAHAVNLYPNGDRAPAVGETNLCTTPEDVAKRPGLSLSLIYARGPSEYMRHTKTFGLVGLIIEAPTANIIHTSAEDCGTPDYGEAALARLEAQGSIIDADTLLRQAGNLHNEIVARGTVGSETLRLAGFYYKATEDGRPYTCGYTGALFHHMQAHAERLGLPMVPITEQNPYTENTVNRSRATINYGGRQYLLAEHKADAFTSREIGQNPHFASPAEIEAALSWAFKAGNLTWEEADDQKEAYEQANAARCTPHLLFAEDGTIQAVTFYEGYGTEERQVIINRNGDSKRVHLEHNIFEEAEQILLGLPERTYASHTPLLREEKTIFIEQACAQLTPAQQAQVLSSLA